MTLQRINSSLLRGLKSGGQLTKDCTNCWVRLLYALKLVDLSRSACNLCLQVLPFAGEETLQQLEANLASMPSVTELLHQGLAPKDITEKLLAGIGVSEGATSMHPRYCHKKGFQCIGVHLCVTCMSCTRGHAMAACLLSVHRATPRA